MEPGGQTDLQELMRQALAMQQQLVEAHAELSAAEVTGTAGGGLVSVTMSGEGEVRRVRIDPSAVDPQDVETLEDLVLAAFHAASDERTRLTQEKLGPLAGGLPDLPDLPGLSGSQ